MNKNIFKAHLEELLKQLSDKEISTNKEKKARLLVGIETQIEMCNLITTRYNKDYSREKGFFSKIQGFILLDEFVQAIDYISTELRRIISISNSYGEDYI